MLDQRDRYRLAECEREIGTCARLMALYRTARAIEWPDGQQPDVTVQTIDDLKARISWACTRASWIKKDAAARAST